MFVKNEINPRIIRLYTVFGWGKFREDGKHRKENAKENSVFHFLAN